MDEPPPLSPSPFGDPAPVRAQNRAAVGKGVLFGCGGCALLLAGMAAVALIASLLVLHFIGDSDFVKQAIRQLNDSPVAQEKLGTPITRGWMANGSVSTENGAGSAEVRISVKGPKAGGELHIAGHHGPGDPWTYTVFEVTLEDTGERLDFTRGERESN